MGISASSPCSNLLAMASEQLASWRSNGLFVARWCRDRLSHQSSSRRPPRRDGCFSARMSRWTCAWPRSEVARRYGRSSVDEGRKGQIRSARRTVTAFQARASAKQKTSPSRIPRSQAQPHTQIRRTHLCPTSNCTTSGQRDLQPPPVSPPFGSGLWQVAPAGHGEAIEALRVREPAKRGDRGGWLGGWLAQELVSLRCQNA